MCVTSFLLLLLFLFPFVSLFFPLSLHDALPICRCPRLHPGPRGRPALPSPSARPDRRRRPRVRPVRRSPAMTRSCVPPRSEEHTSALQSPCNLLLLLLIENKKIN